MTEQVFTFGANRDSYAATGLNLDVSIEGRHVVVALSGEIDVANADSLPAIVAAAVNDENSVRIDIAEVDFLDSSLLRSLLICQSQLGTAGIDVKVRNAQPQARRIFEMTNLTDLLESSN